MKKRQKQLPSSKKKRLESSSDGEESDVERNFALITERKGTEEEEQCYKIGEEKTGEDEERSDSSDEMESDNGEEQEGDEEDGNSEEDDDDDDPEDAGGSNEVQTKKDIRKELSNMSFENIVKLQNQVGTKVYNTVAYGSNRSHEASKNKRLNKNRPVEISAKKPAPFLRQVIPVKKPTLRDPRFDDLSGEYKPEIFEKTYKFINDIRDKEKEIVQKKLKRIKKYNQKKEKLQFLLKRMENQEQARKSKEQQRERELQFKRQQRERASEGGKPFFFKKSDMKKLQLAEKYQELKKSSKLENFLSKKRKRNAMKDRRKLPKQLQSKKAV
ncbi:ribosomal RNA processing protein 36 homolog [Oreochromis niloticus]|uniref:ribosomal RNA processing protein 36 homolog n=1 Tax=Oreochromis niloticus TaxID=8128 RepID=UPI00022B2F4D|nr:ribosomal RNA processing protein 36 homolog [Oreochromis niloticus]XP_005469835.1 ribosomal RNA processing protein 36 homolog [Oreochromis niloticus]